MSKLIPYNNVRHIVNAQKISRVFASASITAPTPLLLSGFVPISTPASEPAENRRLAQRKS